MLSLFEKLRADHGTTIVLVTHDEHVAAIADRTVHMLDGKVIEDAVDEQAELRLETVSGTV